MHLLRPETRLYLQWPRLFENGADRARVCPWCIVDGSAHERFEAEFTDAACVGDHGSWEPIPNSVVEEVAFRTPGFSGWQQERWWTHCADAAEFLGRVGRKEAESLGPGFLSGIRREADLDGDPYWDQYLRA